MTLPPAIVVHSLAHARAAVAPARPVALLSATGAAGFAGVGWWRALVAASGTAGPDLLDCADAPGRALEALAAGCRLVILQPCPAWDSVAARAPLSGARLLAARPPALDLAQPGSQRRIEAWLRTG